MIVKIDDEKFGLENGDYDHPEVIHLGDAEAWRKRQLQLRGGCRHKRLIVDPQGEIITCKDCDKQVSAFWVFNDWMDRYRSYFRKMEAREKDLKDREERGVTLKAAQEWEDAWRSRNRVPMCPHCKGVISPKDGVPMEYRENLKLVDSTPTVRGPIRNNPFGGVEV